MLDEGADWIDVGGESTRPGAPSVSVEEELDPGVVGGEGDAEDAERGSLRGISVPNDEGVAVPVRLGG